MPYKPQDRDEAALLRRAIGKRIRESRTSLGWSQEALAESVGVGAEMLGRYERGLKFPSHVTLMRLAEVLRLTIDDLFGLAPAEKRQGTKAELYRMLDGLSSPQRHAVALMIRELTTPYAPRGR